MPHTHLDVGYTDYQAKVAEAQSRSLDEAIQMIHDHPEFRFSPDGFWCVRQFLKERTEEQKQLLYQAVKDKKIFVPTVEASLLTGFPSLETLLAFVLSGLSSLTSSTGEIRIMPISRMSPPTPGPTPRFWRRRG